MAMKGLVVLVGLTVALYVAVAMTTNIKQAKKIRLKQELMLPVQIRGYTNGEAMAFKTEDGMPCIAWHGKGTDAYSDKTGGLSCDWSWKERCDAE